MWVLFHKFPLIDKKGLEVDTQGKLSLIECQNVVKTLYRNGITASIPKRGAGEDKYYTIFIPNYCKTKVWDLLHPIAVKEGERHRARMEAERLRLIAQDTVDKTGS